MNNTLRGFGLLWQFSGRDTRAQFWWFAIPLLIATNLLSVLILRHDTALLCPGPREIEQAVMCPEMGAQLRAFAVKMSALQFGGVLLLSAAITRRLHDTGKPGTLCFLLLGLLAFHTLAAHVSFQFMDINPAWNIGIALLLTIVGWLEMALQLALVIALCMRGMPDENRFGPSPYPVDIAQTLRDLRG